VADVIGHCEDGIDAFGSEGGSNGIIKCPTTDVAGGAIPPRSLVCNFELKDSTGTRVPFFGLTRNSADGTTSGGISKSCCVCGGGQPLVECNPQLGPSDPAGADGRGPCPTVKPVENAGDPQSLEVPTIIELTPTKIDDPCYTISGTRKCY
jgi:hypothetical protein